jgi:hypothetical protein
MADEEFDGDREYLDRYADADRDEDVAHDLNNRTTGDPTLKRWEKPQPVTTWPCRVCSVPVPVEQSAIETLEVMNAKLRSDGHLEIRTHEVMWCSRCRVRAQGIREAQIEEEVRAVRAAIRVLQEKPEPTDLERQAATMGPCTPDVRASLDAEALMRRVFGFEGDAMIRAHRASKKGKKARVAV